MTHQVTLNLPDSVFKPLAEIAAASGQSVSEVAGLKLAAVVQEEAAGCRLRKWAGVGDSGLDDISTRHHEYLSQGHQCESKAS